ncbi:lysophosphatidylcholine acyltransferase 1 isoform X1 [Hippopotamus amphibius kiboko]|uniref:lysophosphatidylcholine acyltransferase 1 isoform X1 n=2 Tax=Hippopotamus amphibius kiboko TaxID=575201 RepID=UPI002596F91C|nr:lysophosphatidylcholine acyltransferase 1 isoform X1 [Hippopotamus amphibius kiboko]
MRLRGRHPRAAPASSAGAGDARRLAPPGRNPFVHELRLSALQKAQVAVLTLTLFPARLLVAAAMMLLAWPLALVASLGSAEREPEQPLALWRRVVDVLLKAIMRAMWFAGGFHRVVVKGRRAPPTEATILTLAPHSSYFDAIPVTMTMSSIVMKAESRDIPIWGTLIKYIRPVFVSRSDQDSRRKTVEEIRRRAQSGGTWPQIMIFPEGTCTNRTCLITFKPGAFIPGVPVQPVVLRYPNKLDTITWTWQGPGALKILWLTLCQFHNQVEIEFLPVYTPSEAEKKDPALYASNVRRVMAEALGVSVTDYTFEDCQLALAEGQLRLPTDTCLLEFARLVRGLGLKPETLERDLYRHAERAKTKQGGRVTLSEFAAQLGVPESETLEDLFSLFDESGSGEVDLREYVVALSVVCQPSQTLDTIRLAFKMYGSQENGSIDEHALSSILKTALGVAELTVTDLFQAIDQEEKGRITFADFERFAEASPDFAEEYLYPEQTRSRSCAQTPAAPTPNGFCADFSPETSAVGTEPFRKKLD